ncbi:hypothetical protein SAMN05216315_101136 [Nitrosospira sp. Nsp18]|uniref:hypothetical protein n=1 Tax=Nitrosospira sp. Nsp18 TaxID=1855334 RepID=UPI000884BA64|nr:hypothetical protein [Nitrosospira sp. Nsp18]SDA09897.1 hypothetical protein SAMN05216315_101136 [Nitrosospira sp. Nsp18]
MDHRHRNQPLHLGRTDTHPVLGGNPAYGFMPATMTGDLLEQIRDNVRDRSLVVTGRDDKALIKRARQQRRPNTKTKTGNVKTRAPCATTFPTHGVRS